VKKSARAKEDEPSTRRQGFVGFCSLFCEPRISIHPLCSKLFAFGRHCRVATPGPRRSGSSIRKTIWPLASTAAFRQNDLWAVRGS
jgi:hypothetical protein